MELAALSPGDVVVLDHSALHISEAVCLVMERTISASQVALDLVLLENPLDKLRAVA